MNNEMRILASAGLLLLCNAAVQAQSTPDAGKLLRDTERSLEQPRLPDVIPKRPMSEPSKGTPDGAQILVKGFRLQGATLISEKELQALLAPWVGRQASFADLRRAADAIAEAYRAHGYLARTYLPEQDLTEGLITIVIVEGRLGGVRIERIDQARNVSEQAVREYITARQRPGEPVRPDDLQRATTLLNEMPGISASSVLEPGSQEGESQVAVRIKDTPRLTGLIQGDNTGAKSTGEYRVTAAVNANSPFGIGDQLQLLANASTGARFGRMAYSLPVGRDGLRVGANASRLPYSYTLAGVEYTGNASVVGINATYPVHRSNSSNMALAASLDRRAFRNSVQGVELNNKRLTVGTVVLSGDALDGLFGGGLTQYSFGVTSGRLDLAGNVADLATDQVANGPGRQGDFSKFNWSLSRLQRFTSLDTLAVLASGQVANRNLDSSERFVATGPYAVRAYSTSEPSGDDGSLLTLEWRHQFSEMLTSALFFDTARISRDHKPNVGTLSPNGMSFSGAGLGVNYGKANDLAIRASVAWRIGNNPAANPQTGLDSDGMHRDPRVWLTALKVF